MKIALRVYRWIIFSLILQLIALLLMNNVILSGRTNIKDKLKISNYASLGNKADGLDKTITVKIPANAANIKTSYDASYAAYMIDGKLNIYDIGQKKQIKTADVKYVVDKKATAEDGVVTYYEWLPDRNMIIYSIKSSSESVGKVQVLTYDMDTEIQYAYPLISSGLAKGSEIADIELSPQTNVVYVKIKTASNQAKLYKYNVMSELSYIMNVSLNTGIKVLYYTENQVYQDDKNKISIRSGETNKTRQLPFKEGMAILGIDSDDKIYLGELGSDGKVTKIYYGYHDEDVDKNWKQIALQKAAAPDCITVRSNAVYELLKDESAVMDITSGTKSTFKGKYIEMLNDYIVSMNGEELTLKPFKSKK